MVPRVLLALALALALAPSALFAFETLGIDEIHPGMVGEGRTVFAGEKHRDLQSHILGVLRNFGPNQNMILAELEGGPLAHTGIIAGMSGSPVYVDGKLIGAVAYAFPFAKDPIAGITPFQEMVSRDRHPLDPARRGCALVPADGGEAPGGDARESQSDSRSRNLARRVGPARALSGKAPVSDRDAGLGSRLPAGDVRARGAAAPAARSRAIDGWCAGERIHGCAGEQSQADRARGLHRRRSRDRRSADLRHGYGHRRRSLERRRLRVRSSALQPRSHRVPDDALRGSSGASIAHELFQDGFERRDDRDLDPGPGHRDQGDVGNQAADGSDAGGRPHQPRPGEDLPARDRQRRAVLAGSRVRVPGLDSAEHREAVRKSDGQRSPPGSRRRTIGASTSRTSSPTSRRRSRLRRWWPRPSLFCSPTISRT